MRVIPDTKLKCRQSSMSSEGWHTGRMQTPVESDADGGSFAPIRAGSLVGTVRQQVRAAVLHGEIPAGEVLRDSVLATKMGVSRAPVREALRLLEQSGLIEKSANKPYRVKSFSREDLAELAILRIALETTAARLIVAQVRDISEVWRALTSLRSAWDERPGSELNDVDLRFHRAIVEASGVNRLLQRYDDLVDQMVLAWLRLSQYAPRSEGAVAAHEEIVETLERCMETGEAAPIQQLLVEHIRTGMGCGDLII